MDITIVEAPRTTALTTLARMRRELGIPPSNTSNDERLTDLIEEVSSAVVAFCQQPLIRQTVTERQVGFGRSVQMLSVTPVPRAAVTGVRFGDTTVSGCTITDEKAGFIYRRECFADTRPVRQWIERDPVSMPGSPDWEFDYSGGYVLPGDDIVASGTCVANAADNSFELVGTPDYFPILVSGEFITVVGFATTSNNGRFKVLGRTPTKLFVGSALTQEAPSGVTVVACRNLPPDLEGAVVVEVKARFRSQRRDPSIKAESLGDWSATYGGSAEGSYVGLCAAAAGMLDRYVRVE